MLELIVGLIPIMVLLLGITRITSLTTAQTETLIEARTLAGTASMSSGVSVSAFPDQISDVTVGTDGKAYSADDETTSADPVAFQNTIVDKTASTPSDWDVLDALPSSPITALRNTAAPVEEFGLVEGTDERTVILPPGIRLLLYDAKEIAIRSRVWMPRTEGIY
jgi:hypothetical protein